jgi:NAD(P)-dependent dehydrogenase (short-subunit alcohol dehydrogenase family)
MADRVVVLTGASSGIGASLAKQLGAQGQRLVLAARRTDLLAEVARQSGPHAVAVPTDVTRRDEVLRLRDEALRAFGAIDVWINNAGRGISRSVLDLSDADVDEMITVNLKSALYGMQAVVPHFQQRGAGHLINVSSFLSRVPLAGPRSAYSAAKHALNALTANLRMDLARTHPGIRVSLVMPGIVLTDFGRNALGGAPAGFAPPSAGPMKAQTADEVAAAIVALIDAPRAEIYTNPTHRELALRYFGDVAAFEAELLAPRE